ncbi:DUF3788 domain-containing protein [Maribacter sp. HTCC2170]|uniref:DUF3788 domain-containing protein n=1 Tax=Maribacter sp. (strain HTCC2170 / KCCM 42371) TaxID=313603 RepID=UPI00006B2264|nr:DUF3788 domain-containing protein [Maribacter sp. HTCC2170]EAR00350.1 hypothetical protein FB2170_13051 [Maribacter sp. HTCC2170]
MDDLSIFPDKAKKPTENNLASKLGKTHDLWKKINSLVLEKYPEGAEEWFYSGKKYGWNYRIKDKKRAIIYFSPRDNFFKAGFIFGNRALKDIMESTISDTIKEELRRAPKYGEGTGLRLDIINDGIIPDIEQLINFKLKY